MATLADVDLTVGARDETGQTLSNIDNRLVDMNKTLEKQLSVFEKVEQQYTAFVDKIEMSAPTIKSVFDKMTTELTQINKALRENEKAQKDVNKETAKAGRRSAGHAINTELYKKIGDVDVDVRDDRREQSNRAALAEQDSFNNNLLQKELEGSQQRLSVITQSSQEKTLEEKRSNDNRFNEQQTSLDRQFNKLKESNAEIISEIKSHEQMSGNIYDQMAKNELSSYDKSTKIAIDKTKEKHDKIIGEQKAANKGFSDIRKDSLKEQIADSQTSLQNSKAAAQAQTQVAINEITNRYERQRSINEEFRGKALANLEAEQKKELSQIDSTRTLKIELTKREHDRQTAEITDHLNKKDSELSSHYDRDIQQSKSSAESLSSIQDQKHAEEIAEIKSFHNAVESAAKSHEDELLQIKKHARRVDLEKESHGREVGREEMLQRQRSEKAERKRIAEAEKQSQRDRIASMKAERKRLEQVKKDEDAVAIRRAKSGVKTATERSDIDLDETLSKQKALHDEQLAQDKRFADEKIAHTKRTSKESTAVIEAEGKAQAKARKESAREQMATAQKQSDRILDELKRSQEDELESLKQFGSKRLSRRKRRHQAQLEDFHDERAKVRNVIEDSLDKEVRLEKQAADKREAVIEKSARNSITERNKQATNEIRAITKGKQKEIDVIKSSLSEKEIEYNKQKREGLLRLQVQHQQEIDLIDVHDKVKIAQLEKTHAVLIANEKSYHDKNYAVSKQGLDKQLSQLESHLNVSVANKESGRDKDLADMKSHSDKVADEEENRNKKSLAELESYGRKRLAEIDHITKKEEAKIRKSQRGIFKRMSDDVKGSGFGRFIAKADRVTSGFLAADFAMIGVREIWDFVRGLGQALVTMEAMKLSLTAVEGSAEKAYAQLKNIAEIAKLPGVHLESAIKTTVTLRALKLEAQLVERTIIAIGNALATLGRESELGGVTLALSQIIGKGKVHAEEINQIAERLPLIRGVLVEQFGTANTEILQKMDIKITDFVAKITEGLENLPKVATTIGTELKNMKNQWFLFKAGLATLMKPAFMTAIRAWTTVLDGANKILEAMNKRKEDEIIQADKIKRSQQFTEEYLLSTGKHAKTNKDMTTSNSVLLKSQEDYARHLKGETVREGGKAIGLVVLNKRAEDAARNINQMNRVSERYTKTLKSLDSNQTSDRIKVLQERKETLEPIAAGPTQGGAAQKTRRAKLELDALEIALQGYKDLFDKKIAEEAVKIFGDGGDKAKKLAEATRDYQEQVINEILGVGFKDNLTEQKLLSLKNLAQSSSALKSIDFSIFVDDLEAFQNQKEYAIEKEMAYLNTQESNFVRKADRNKFAAARDLFPEKTKGLSEKDPKMIEFAEQAEAMQLSRISQAYDVLRSETKLQIEKAFQFELEYQQWRAEQVKTHANRLSELYKDIANVPTTTEGIESHVIGMGMAVKDKTPDKFRDKVGGIDFADTFARDVIASLRETSAIKKAEERPSTFVHQAAYAKMDSLAREYVSATEMEIDGKQKSVKEIADNISFLESKLPEFESFVKEREKLHKRISQLDKDKIKAEVDLAKQGADALKRSPDVIARSVEDIQSVLKTAKLEAMRHEIVGRDDLADPYLKQKDRLEKELQTAEKKVLQDRRAEIKSQIKRDKAEGILTTERIKHHIQLLKSLQVEAKAFGTLPNTIQNDLDQLFANELDIRRKYNEQLKSMFAVFGVEAHQALLDSDLVSPEMIGRVVGEKVRRDVDHGMRKKAFEESERRRHFTPEGVPITGSELTPFERDRSRGFSGFQRLEAAVSPEGIAGTTPDSYLSEGFRNQMDAMENYRLRAAQEEERQLGITPQSDFHRLSQQEQAVFLETARVRLSADRQIEDHALSAAANIVSAWQSVSSQTDTMLDDVVGAIGQVAVNLTQTILSIQRSSQIANNTSGLTSTLGSFAKYAGIAGIGLTAAATVYSFIDSKSESKQQRNKVSRSRPVSVSRR